MYVTGEYQLQISDPESLLASVTFENPEARTGLDIDTTRVNAGEIVALFRHVIDASYLWAEQDAAHAQGGPEPDPQATRLAEYETTVWNFLADLPERDIEKARAVYDTLGHSPRPRDRYRISGLVSYITRADHDFGRGLWADFISDPHPDVRWDAHDQLMDLLETDYATEIPNNLAARGLNSDDLVYLLRKHAMAPGVRDYDVVGGWVRCWGLN